MVKSLTVHMTSESKLRAQTLGSSTAFNMPKTTSDHQEQSNDISPVPPLESTESAKEEDSQAPPFRQGVVPTYDFYTRI